MKKNYGKELILDLHNCNNKKFNRENLKQYFRELCVLIDMKRCKLVWWDDHGVPVEQQQTAPHLKGTSAVQFIMTSNITIHTLDIMKNVYLNIFSCKDFDALEAKKFSEKFFGGKTVNFKIVDRK
ncbi:MAG: S-adenosylmethionine decarboxylase [Candidatus Azambacteria bacterium GW2011_GWA2_39_10]|uniref:S-adenosylmethionine decarboxylase n=1 Tax=Candidatus Azambacteria bacterium GW2011_GWA2_39_10 TaxID=1618611 RepID=A0A0G0P456_9BACT|nr:MAG: S-adenosylmethionine decarboxylase [Candidatus Azambacteria bacterium GW2011_GWA2_39_10]